MAWCANIESEPSLVRLTLAKALWLSKLSGRRGEAQSGGPGYIFFALAVVCFTVDHLHTLGVLLHWGVLCTRDKVACLFPREIPLRGFAGA